jgi:hypothetical protein
MTIKVIEAITNVNSMSRNSRIVGKNITFDNSKFDYECEQYKIIDYKPMLNGEYRLFIYSDGHIELSPKNPKCKSITILKYETVIH